MVSTPSREKQPSSQIRAKPLASNSPREIFQPSRNFGRILAIFSPPPPAMLSISPVGLESPEFMGILPLAITNTDRTIWILATLGALYLVYFTFIRPARRRKKDPLEDPGPRISLAQQRAVEREMNHVLVELSDMARQVSAQIDTRSARLEALIQDADRRIQTLRHIQGDGPAPAESVDPIYRETTQPDPRYEQVYSLADQGQSAQDISRALNRPRGEIDLILALRES
jgi:hypothetical protein